MSGSRRSARTVSLTCGRPGRSASSRPRPARSSERRSGASRSAASAVTARPPRSRPRAGSPPAARRRSALPGGRPRSLGLGQADLLPGEERQADDRCRELLLVAVCEPLLEPLEPVARSRAVAVGGGRSPARGNAPSRPSRWRSMLSSTASGSRVRSAADGVELVADRDLHVAVLDRVLGPRRRRGRGTPPRGTPRAGRSPRSRPRAGGSGRRAR